MFTTLQLTVAVPMAQDATGNAEATQAFVVSPATSLKKKYCVIIRNNIFKLLLILLKDRFLKVKYV